MSSSKPEDGGENVRKRKKTIHLPSVDPHCYLAAHGLDLGDHEKDPSQLTAHENWDDLRQILLPIVDLVVKDALGQYYVDNVRRRFDSTFCGRRNNNKREYPFIVKVIRRKQTSGICGILKMLLAAGLDPDLPDAMQCRPSHWCSFQGRADLAALIFPCRPCLTAVTKAGFTALQVASANIVYKRDNMYPERKFLRKDVKKLIETGGFEQGFPSIAELAIRGQWFAVKNLLRRQVVAAPEFDENLDGKTAAEWADYYGESGIAEEIRYYATAPSVRLNETAKLTAAMVEKLLDTEEKEMVLSSKVIKLEKRVEELEKEAVVNGAKNKELLEAVTVYRRRFEESGAGTETDEGNSFKLSVPEYGESSVASGSDLGGPAGASSSFPSLN